MGRNNLPSRRAARAPKRGFALILVIILALLVGVFVLIFTNSAMKENRDTHRLVRSIRAEALAESVASMLAAVINQYPWEERFYLNESLVKSQETGEAPPIEYAFNHTKFPFNETGPEFASGTSSFFGLVRDVDVPAKKYRVRVLIEHQGESYLYVYEMRYAQNLLGQLNRDPVVHRQLLLEDVPPDQVDARVDAIWRAADDASRKLVIPTEGELATRALAEPRFEGTLTGVENTPVPPPEVVSSWIARSSNAPGAARIAAVLAQGLDDPASLRVPLVVQPPAAGGGGEVLGPQGSLVAGPDAAAGGTGSPASAPTRGTGSSGSTSPGAAPFEPPGAGPGSGGTPPSGQQASLGPATSSPEGGTGFPGSPPAGGTGSSGSPDPTGLPGQTTGGHAGIGAGSWDHSGSTAAGGTGSADPSSSHGSSHSGSSSGY